MARTVGIGIQCFDKIRENHYFYIDKTSFIKEWWESGDDVTLITRPRRFGKTLNMSMVEEFFSVDYDAIILEFKVYDPDSEETLQDTASEALKQIERKQYAAQLMDRGVPKERIRSYRFAFHGKKVLIA